MTTGLTYFTSLLFVVCFMCPLVQSKNCTDVDPAIISTPATECFVDEISGFATGDTETKCNILLDEVLPCILKKMETEQNVTCTLAEQYRLVISVQNILKDFLVGFEVILECLDKISCDNIESIEYYLERLCPGQVKKYKESDSEQCWNLCLIARCFKAETDTTTVPHDECTTDNFNTTIMAKATKWEGVTGKAPVNLCCQETTTTTQTTSTTTTSKTTITSTQATTTENGGTKGALPQKYIFVFGVFLSLVMFTL